MANDGKAVINDRYEIVQRVGRGGMADVFLARDVLLDRPVAVKVLFPEYATDPAFVERFRREAQAAANLNHPNIVSVYDWGRVGNTYFMAMEYVEGRTLADILRSDQALTSAQAADIASEVAAALAFAHRNGVVHRDVKPANILIGSTGVVKVADFGIARAVDTAQEANLTQTGAVMGTATYFSPEQAQGGQPDPRSDVYSLGIVLYEMVAGAPPFLGENAVSVAYKQVHDQPRPLNQIVLDIPRAFEAIVAKCLAKDPTIRYQSADALRDDLRRFREGADVGALIEALGGSMGAVTTVMASTPMSPSAPRGDAMTTQALPVVGANDALSNVATPPVGVPVVGPGGTQVMPQVAVPQGAVLPPYEDDRPRRGGGYIIAAIIAVLALLGGGFALFTVLTDDEASTDFTVPNVVNLSLSDASKVLLDRGLTPVPLPVAKDGVGDDVVYSQDPLPDVVSRKGDEVNLTYNPKKAPVVVPAIQGLTVKDATALLVSKGLTLTISEVRTDPAIPLNQIISQDPGGNAEVPAGSAVKVVVSGGAGQVTVPSIDGQLQEAAEKLLKSAPYNFIVTVQTEVSDTVEKGRVVRTDPAIGAPIDSGNTIVIYISSGPQQVEVPDVEGRTEGEARVTLYTRGLAVEVIYVDVPAGSLNDGKVISQGVPFKTMVDPTTSIKLTVGKAVVATTLAPAPSPAPTVAPTPTAAPTPTVAPTTSGA